MKKAAAILLLAVLGFNWIGYRFVSSFLEHRNDVAVQSRIDRAAYDQASLIQITVPLDAPYFTGNSTGFERYDGQIDVNGVRYRYVKRKIEDGNLVLLCLPDKNSSRFQNARMDFFKLVNDLNQPTQNKGKNSGIFFKTFTAEYSPEKNSWQINAGPSPFQDMTFSNVTVYTADYDAIIKQPPRA